MDSNLKSNLDLLEQILYHGEEVFNSFIRGQCVLLRNLAGDEQDFWFKNPIEDDPLRLVALN